MNEEDKKILRQIAHDSIAHGLEKQKPLEPDLSIYVPQLLEKRATFVTLYHHGSLRGCVGTIEALRPLIVDVSRNAFAAAFRDSRFAPLAQHELNELEISISILSSKEKIIFTSEEDLVSQIRVGIDGLVLKDGRLSGVFIPSVWEDIKDPAEFLNHLKIKAGLSPDYWSHALTVERFTVEKV